MVIWYLVKAANNYLQPIQKSLRAFCPAEVER